MCSPAPRSSSRSASSSVSGVADRSRLHSCRLKSRYGECGSPTSVAGSMGVSVGGVPADLVRGIRDDAPTHDYQVASAA